MGIQAASFCFYKIQPANTFKVLFMDQQVKKTITECIRCGTCCMKGGPALHEDDIKHVDGGVIPLTALYTIRKGELAYDNVNSNGGLIRQEAEIIKIKSLADSKTCMYFDDANKSCEIYDNRPIECRVLECWDTTGIEKIYSRDRLNRNKVLRNVSWLLELINAHESKCAFEKIQALVNARESGDHSAAPELSKTLNYDSHFRNLVIEKGNVPSDMLDFLFGRPLFLIVQQQFGIKINRYFSDAVDPA